MRATVLLTLALLPALWSAGPASLLPPAWAQDDPDGARQELRRTPVVDAVRKAGPSVVSIGTKELVQDRFFGWGRSEKLVPGALGSGVIVHPRGYVVTNLHVIRVADEIFVKLTGLGKDEAIPAKLIAVEPVHDLALLRMMPEGPYPALPLGRSDDLMVGETAIALGNPYGIGQTVTTGVISALARDITVRGKAFKGLIQTDAAVNQGNSGGALLNTLGEWIGVNSAIYSLSGGSDGISFAIPVETVSEFLAGALRPRRVADVWLGIEFGRDDRGRSGIAEVYPVGPAAEIGVPANVEVSAVNGLAVRNILELRLAVLDAIPTGSAVLTLRTDDGNKTVTVPFRPMPTDALSWRRLGLKCAPLAPKVATTEGYRAGFLVRVNEVRKEGPAARIGIREGDLIQRVGPRKVGSMEDLLLFLEYSQPRQVLEIVLGRPYRDPNGIVRLREFDGSLTTD